MKDSFILHHDTLSVINELTDEQAGQLIKEIYAYSDYINNPKEAKKPSGLNGLMNSVLHPFKMQLDRDLEKYLRVVERNQKNGKKGGRPTKEKTQVNPSKPKKADSDKEKESDNDSDKEKEINMLENEFQAIWKDYTLSFLKSQGRQGGAKKTALSNYKKIRAKYSHDEILNIVDNHKKQKIAHKDLERVLRLDFIKQVLEDNISFEDEPTAKKGSFKVPNDLIGKEFYYESHKCKFEKDGYFDYQLDYKCTYSEEVQKAVNVYRQEQNNPMRRLMNG